MEGSEGSTTTLVSNEKWVVHFICVPTMTGRDIIFGSLFLQWRRADAANESDDGDIRERGIVLFQV